MRILVAEDDEVTRRILEQALVDPRHDVELTVDGTAAWERILAEPPTILVTDWMMPGMDGPDLIRRIRSASLPHYVYTILVTARTAVDDVIEGLDAGADDYLSKPFDLRELQGRIRIGERIVNMERQLREAREMQWRLATRDPMSGLFSRETIRDLAEAELARVGARRGHRTAAVARRAQPRGTERNRTSTRTGARVRPAEPPRGFAKQRTQAV
jgi:DNA-binding response OmpR family regulator